MAAFEELVGSHGGMGGGQSYPFALVPADWQPPEEPVVGRRGDARPLPRAGSPSSATTPTASERGLMRARLRRRGGGRRTSRAGRLHRDRRRQLTGVFAAPRWLRDVGFTAWLLVGVALLLVGAVWLLSLTHTIVVPVIAAGVIAAVAAPLVAWLAAPPRASAGGRDPAAARRSSSLGALVVFIVIAGITSQIGDLERRTSTDAKNTIEGWLKDLGVSPSTAQRREGRRQLRRPPTP